jgi:imidazoleglycerol-phosphate dehydratase
LVFFTEHFVFFQKSSSFIDAEVEVTMDLSNRPHIIHDLFKSTTEEYAGDLSVEMLVHALESLATNSKSTVHVVERRVGKCALETFIATAIAYGRALRMCGAVDPRRAGKTASSKGTLSV